MFYTTEELSDLLVDMTLKGAPKGHIQKVVDYKIATHNVEKMHAEEKADFLKKHTEIGMLMEFYQETEDEA